MNAGGLLTMDTTTHANFIPEIWSDGVIEAAESALVMAGLVNRAYEGEIKAKGDKVNIPNVSNLTANDKATGTAVTVQAPTEGSTTLTINKHKEVSFYVEDILSAQANVDLRNKYTEKAGYALAKAIDSDLLALYSGLSQTAGAGSTAITDDIILNAMMQLDDVDVPEFNRFLVIKPSQKATMLKLQKFVGAEYRGDEKPGVSGVIGDIYGMKVYVTNQVVAANDIAYNLCFQSDAFALAIQMDIRFQAEYQLEYLSWLLVGDVVYGVAELQDVFAVQVLTTNVAPTT